MRTRPCDPFHVHSRISAPRLTIVNYWGAWLSFLAPCRPFSFSSTPRTFPRLLCVLCRQQLVEIPRTVRPVLCIYCCFSAECCRQTCRQAKIYSSQASDTLFHFCTSPRRGSCSTASLVPYWGWTRTLPRPMACLLPRCGHLSYG